MVMPGEHFTGKIWLRKPMYLIVGDRFTFRENQITVISGIITKDCSSEESSLEPMFGFNTVSNY